ncbi:MAG TPA: secondary thiamine-phosphate synthase enzyme YjbQ [bacterium]|nr:secondary thiamine-phosphate synthase enzyme YjbQ [bacterium]
MRQTLTAAKTFATTLTVPTRDRVEIINLTDQIQALPGVRELLRGFVLVHSLHTTTGLCLNEFQEALLHDIKAFLARLAPQDGGYRHNDPAFSDDTRNNAASHLGAITLGQTLHVPIEQGTLVLGTWQRILFCELDGPQTRRVYAQVMGV